MSYDDLGQDRIPVLRPVGRADEEPPARRRHALGRARRRLDPRPGPCRPPWSSIPAAVIAEIGEPFRRRHPGRHLRGAEGGRADRRHHQLPGHPRRSRRRHRLHHHQDLFDTSTMVAAHAAAKKIKLENAIKHMPLPLHPGAERYYREKGLISSGRRPVFSSPAGGRLEGRPAGRCPWQGRPSAQMDVSRPPRPRPGPQADDASDRLGRARPHDPLAELPGRAKGGCCSGSPSPSRSSSSTPRLSPLSPSQVCAPSMSAFCCSSSSRSSARPARRLRGADRRLAAGAGRRRPGALPLDLLRAT